MTDHSNMAGANLHEDKRVKQPVRAASTANVSLSTPGAAIDGVTLASGDRILLKDQTTASQNGLYTWTGAAAALVRATDAAAAADFVFGFLTYVREGTANGATYWTFTQSAAVTVGTTALTFAQLGTAGTFSGEVSATDFKATGLTGSVAASRYVGATATGAPSTGAHLLGDFVIDQTGKIWICTTAGTPGTWTQSASSATSYSASGLTGATAASRYVGATASGAPASGTFAVGDFVVDQTGKLWVCTSAGTPGTWTQVSGSGGGAGGSGVPQSSSLGSDVSMPSLNTAYDGPTLTLAAGTWLLNGTVTVVCSVATNVTAKLWDGTTVVAMTETTTSGTNPVTLSLGGSVSPTGSTTYKITVLIANGGTGTIKAQTPHNAVGNTACTLTATPVFGYSQSASAAAVATSGTIATAGVSEARVSPAGAVTGVILQAGTYAGQEVTVVNEAIAANSVTFAASGTSNVADGTASVIAGLKARKFTWNSATSLWYPNT